MFCQRLMRNIDRIECNYWNCKYWIGNGGTCIPKFDEVKATI